MRHGALNVVQRSNQHENLIQNTNFTILYEIAVAAYLTISHQCQTVHNGCILRPDIKLERFMVFILYPVFVVRMITLVVFRSRFSKLEIAQLLLAIYWNLAYALWTVISLH